LRPRRYAGTDWFQAGIPRRLDQTMVDESDSKRNFWTVVASRDRTEFLSELFSVYKQPVSGIAAN
jgi:hypothetical protein